MNNINRTILLITLLSCHFAAYNQQDNNKWTLAKNQDGVIVYTRKSENSPVKEFKVLTTINTNLETIVKILCDPDKFPEWQVNCEYATMLKKVNENEFYNYFRADLPWPFSDRDMIVNFKYNVDYEKKEFVAISKTKPDFISRKKGLKRLEKGNGVWKIKEIDNKVHIMYKFAGDPGIPVPAWLINMFLVDGPFKSFCNLKTYATHIHS